MKNSNGQAGQAANGGRRRDRRLAAIVAGIIAIAAVGYIVSVLPDRSIDARSRGHHSGSGPFPELAGASRAHAPVESELELEPLADPAHDPHGHARQARTLEIRARFEQAVVMLHAKRYDEAITALHRVMELNPGIPEAYVNMGFALLGKQAYPAAFDFFMGAIEMNPAQANAYYGIAMVQEALGNLEGALGGMRAFLHLTSDPDPYRLHVARARSAIWEWEARLGRGPWGPTRGIPPGLREDEVQRDGRGVGIKMPIGNAEDGTVRYEIKSGERTQIFDRQ